MDSRPDGLVRQSPSGLSQANSVGLYKTGTKKMTKNPKSTTDARILRWPGLKLLQNQLPGIYVFPLSIL
jgi:hypothetical protein